MATNPRADEAEAVAGTLPNPALFLEAQRALAESSSRMTSTICDYAKSVGEVWVDVWTRHLNECMKLPNRFAKVNSDFFDRALEQYRDNAIAMEGLAEKAGSETVQSARRAGAAGEKFAGKLAEEARETMAGEGRFSGRETSPEERPPSSH